MTGSYVPQYLGSLVRTDTASGEYRLRVRNTERPEFPPPPRVELGQPMG